MSTLETVESAFVMLTDSELISQFVFVESKKERATLLGDIDESQLPDVYGGRLQLVPIQDS